MTIPALIAPPTPRLAPEDRWRFEWVRPLDLSIDPTYHDSSRFQESRAIDMGKHWDEEKVGVLHVSRRPDGRLILMDGNHRRGGAIFAGVDRVPAKVFEGLSITDEAHIFEGLSDARRLSPLALFKSRVAGGRAIEVGVMEILDKHGVRVGSGGAMSKQPNATRAVSALLIAHRGGVLDPTLAVLRRAWPEDGHALNATPILGVASCLYAYGSEWRHPRFNQERLITKLAEISAGALERLFGELRALTNSRASWGAEKGSTVLSFRAQREAVVRVYNRRTPRPLPDMTYAQALRFGVRNPWAEDEE